MLKKFYLLFILLLPFSAMAQSLSLFDVDASSFPTIKAKFYAFDASGKQVLNLNPQDFELKEDGQPRSITHLSCPAPEPPQAISSVLVFDVSGSMSSGPPRIQSAKNAANAWVDGLPLGKSECALVSFSDVSLILKDFTTNRQYLQSSIANLIPTGGTNYNQALIDLPCGGLQIANNGKYKKVLIFLTDGLPNFEPKTNEIIQFANANDITIYAVTLDMPAPQSIKDMTLQTKGNYFENITSLQEAEETYQKLLLLAQGGDPCSIEWQSEALCTAGNTNVQLTLLQNGTKATSIYQSPNQSVAKLEFNPTSLKFENPTPGVYATPQKVIVTARNADFTVSNISTQIPVGFQISPNHFNLKNGKSIELTVTYFPADSGYNYCRFDVENDPCPTKFYVSGGWKGKKPTIRTLKLLHPNGDEVFIAGFDTVITWEGVAPDEPVNIEYSTDNGVSWIVVTESAKGLSYKWRVPRTPSGQCLARVTAAAKTTSSYCDNPDVEICGNIWMGCNLDVETYRNGEPIPEITDSLEWSKLTTGAWCYYNNDPANGEIYGKIYNWYAVNDPRGLAPDGWHVATDTEWTALENCLISNGYNYDGTTTGNKIAKALATASGWTLSSNAGAIGNTDYPAKRNATGFSALPGGYRSYNGSYSYIGYSGYWWSATVHSATSAWGRYLFYYGSSVGRCGSDEGYGLSVRCVRD